MSSVEHGFRRRDQSLWHGDPLGLVQHTQNCWAALKHWSHGCSVPLEREGDSPVRRFQVSNFPDIQGSNRATSWPPRYPASYFQRRTESCPTLATAAGCSIHIAAGRENQDQVRIRSWTALRRWHWALVAHYETHMQKLCNRFAQTCEDLHMTISLRKTVVVWLGAPQLPRIFIKGSLFGVVGNFSHLRCIGNSCSSLDDKISQRIWKASTSFGWHISRVWNNNHLTIKLNIRIYVLLSIKAVLFNHWVAIQNWVVVCFWWVTVISLLICAEIS